MSTNKQALREAAQEEIMLRSASDTSDAWQDEASPEAVLALLDELEDAEKRIAELEAREINLPPNELVTDTWTSPGDGWEVFDAQKVVDSIRVAGVKIADGITVKGDRE